jgi:outer membrane protein assembly factor BamA
MAGLSNGRRRLLLRRRVARILCFSRRRSPAALFLIVGLSALTMWLPALSVLAQTVVTPAQELPERNDGPGRLLVAEVSFDGNPFFNDEQLNLHVRTKPNRRLLGVPGFTWWLWLYRFGDQTLGGRLGKAFRASGEAPAYLDSTLVAADVERLRQFYTFEGFRSATVVSTISHIRETERVHVSFLIESGPPTWIRTLNYRGLDSLTPEQKREVARNSLLRPERLDDNSPLVYQPRQQRYSEPLLEEEGRRLMGMLRDQGYADVDRESIHAVIYAQQPDSFDVTIDVKLGPRYRFGDLHFKVSGPVADSTSRRFSEYLDSFENDIPGGVIDADFVGEKNLDFDLITRALQFHPGDWYDRSKLLATKRRIDATGVFTFSEILSGSADSTRGPLSGPTRLNHRFSLQTRRRHQVRMQMFMLQRTGALADADNELGTGLSIAYTNLNMFGGGESFQFKNTGSIAADLGGRGGFTSTQYELTTSLSYPYLIFPLEKLDRKLNLYDARTRISLSLLVARRDALRLILRGRGSARVRYELRHTKNVTSLVDVLDIAVSNPDTLDGFQRFFLNDILNSVEDPVQRAQIIEDYTVPQFNNAFRYTFHAARLDPFRRESGYSHEVSVELGGNLGYLLDRFVYTPGTVEGSLPGLPFFRGRGSGNQMIYRQYFRLSADFRRFIRMSTRSVLAWKFILGFAQPMGQARVVPFDRRFYSGGASSVRAWRLRELGPGSASFANSADSVRTGSTNILGGDIKLEGSLEWRQTFIQELFAARWIMALFADAGNVWFGPRNPGSEKGRFHVGEFLGEVGVGAGFGIRLAWDYLIIRFDFAYKVHDPLRRGELLPDGFRRPVVQFGIGHTF